MISPLSSRAIPYLSSCITISVYNNEKIASDIEHYIILCVNNITQFIPVGILIIISILLIFTQGFSFFSVIDSSVIEAPTT